MYLLFINRFSPCLALTVNRLNINATDQLKNADSVIYDLVYIIEFDSTSRSIINVYLREGLCKFYNLLNFISSIFFRYCIY